jgi:ATP-dependent Zn protease
MQFSLLYIDPGTSSMLIQMIVAGALGVVFFFKNGWYKLKSFFGAKKKKEADDNPEP